MTTETSYTKHHGAGKPFRQGSWRCSRDTVRMKDSLEIWQHLDLFTKPAERTASCVTSDIYFDCSEHGEEAA